MKPRKDYADTGAGSGCMARLVRLSDCWKGRAAKKFMDAKDENDEMGRKLIEHGAMCYFNAAMELEEALKQNQAVSEPQP